MTIHEQCQLELAAWLFVLAAVPLLFAARWLIRRRRWQTLPTMCAVLILALCAAAFALADGERGKPVPPQVYRYMRVRREWLKWTQAVKASWLEMLSGITFVRERVEVIDTEIIAITNTVKRPARKPPVMQLRPNLLNNPNNQNIKLRPKNLTNNGDGTWTVEVQASREITDEPAIMMYLRRRRDGATWWVEHESTSYPSNTSVNAYTYTFRPPVGVDGYIAAADEILLGGPNGCQIEGVVLVDPVNGKMYEGITGDYIIDGRPVQIKGGVFKMEPKAATQGEGGAPEPMAKSAGAGATRYATIEADQPAERLITGDTRLPANGGLMIKDGGALTARDLIPDVVAEEPDVPKLKLAMPPLDAGGLK